MIKLTDTEKKILEELWNDGPLTTMDLYRKLNEKEGWSKSTVITLLNRMLIKGTIRYEVSGNSKLYHAKVSKESVDISETRSFLDKIYNGNVGLMISNLIKNEEISKEELEEIKKIIREGE
ncbi:MAG: BlaI/MecI/CopY family transcriptional regulator [Clostridiales bacterium]|nr:BlaI/MecI/CopY family transcriptional regulator [Clostridiales bacterium]